MQRKLSTKFNTVNYKLAFTKDIANDWTTKAFAICLYGDWTPCCYSCRSSTTPEGVQGGARHSVLQGIWWDRSLDSWMFFSSVQSLSPVWLFVTHESQHARPPCPSPTHRVFSNSCPWVSDAIQPSHPLLSPSPPAPKPSQHQSFPMSQLFSWGGQSIGVSASTSVLLMNTRTDLLQNGLVGSPCSPRDSQESSPTSQFKSINSSVLSLLHIPTLTTIHDHWENHSLDLSPIPNIFN